MDVWCTPDCTDFDVNGAVGTLTISDIISFVDVLSISNITDLDNLVICNSPGLRILELPLVTSLSSIVISDADILQEIFLPMLIPGNTRVTDSGSYTEDQLPLSLNITNAPILNEVDLKNSGSWKDLILSGTNSFFPVRAQIGVTSSLRAYGCVEFLDLVEVGSLQLTVDSNDSYLCGYSLNNLTSVGNLTIFNTDVLNGEAFAGSNLIQVNNSLILKPSIPAHPPTTRFDTKFGRISAITNNLDVSSMLNMSILFDGLISVGGNISISNNTNCLFDFTSLSEATNINLTNNADSLLPLFPALKTVNNINMRGRIDMSNGPDIFPSLLSARGSVIIEAWNPDFNCSTLVSQFNDRVIHSLSCNGTGNESLSSLPTPPVTSPLPPASLAGIGVGTAVFVLLVIIVIMWLVLHYRHRLKRLEQKLTARFISLRGSFASSHRADRSGTHELDGADLLREKPDDHIPAEKPDDHIVELPAEEAASSRHQELASN